MCTLSRMPHLCFIADSTSLYITGKTFIIKEELKKAKAIWNAEKAAWILPVELDNKTFRDEMTKKVKEALVSTEVNAEKAVMFALEQKEKNGSYSWICCKDCKVINWKRQTTTCNTCALDCGLYKNAFRVRGCVYTGD